VNARLGRRSSAADLPDILCGPDVKGLPADSEDKWVFLHDAEKDFRLIYGMGESIMTLKEQEERSWQAADGGDGDPLSVASSGVK